MFGEKPEYKKGDVIVSGITENSLEGYIRRVLKVDKKNNLYIVKTEPAVLTDVFEKVHIYKKIELTEDGSQSVSYKTESMKGEKKREVLLFIASVKFFCKFRYSMIIDCGLTAVFGG